MNLYGDGSDGHLVIVDADVHLTRDMQYETISIPPGGKGKLYLEGFRLYVRSPSTNVDMSRIVATALADIRRRQDHLTLKATHHLTPSPAPRGR